MVIRVLVGMIASGKSTLAKRFAEAGCVTINDDDIVTMLHGGVHILYRRDLKPLYKGVENFILGTAVAMKQDVVVDKGTNVRLSSRQRWLAFAKSFDIPCIACVLPKTSAEEHARRRATADSRGLGGYPVWLEIAKAHEAEYVEPTIAEGFDAIHHVS